MIASFRYHRLAASAADGLAAHPAPAGGHGLQREPDAIKGQKFHGPRFESPHAMDVKFTSAQQEAYAYIHERIVDGSYAPGDHLRTNEIAEELSISRMPIREALRQLEAEGLVFLRPNRGMAVMNLSVDEVQDLLELRALLEGLIVRHAMPQLTGIQLYELELLRERMDRCHGDAKAWVQHHAEFHNFISAHTARPQLAAIVSRIGNLLQPSIYAYISEVGHEEMLGHEHELLISAIKDQNAVEAERIAGEHVRQFGVQLTRYLEKRNKRKPRSAARKRPRGRIAA